MLSIIKTELEDILLCHILTISETTPSPHYLSKILDSAKAYHAFLLLIYQLTITYTRQIAWEPWNEDGWEVHKRDFYSPKTLEYTFMIFTNNFIYEIQL